MPVYDCRREGREPGSVGFPCAVRVLCAATGRRLANVFYASTSPARVGRFVTGPGGEPMVDSRTRRKRVFTNARGLRECEILYDRLEVWEARPWVAVAADTGEVVAKSEGAP